MLLKKLKHWQRKLGPAKILLIAIINLLGGCAGAPEFPTKDLWQVSYQSLNEGEPKEWRCLQYELIDPENLKYKYVGWHAITRCIGVFGFSSQDIPKVLSYGPKLKKYYQEQCKKK